MCAKKIWTPRKGTVTWFMTLPLVCSSETLEGLFKLFADYFRVDRSVFFLYDGDEWCVPYLIRSDGGKTLGIRVRKNRRSGRWQARASYEEEENNMWRGVAVGKECYEEWAGCQEKGDEQRNWARQRRKKRTEQ